MSKIHSFPLKKISQYLRGRGIFTPIFGFLLPLSVVNTAIAADPAQTPLSLKLEDQLQIRKDMTDERALTFTSSNKIEGVNDRVMKLEGNAQVRRNGSVVKGDLITYDPDTDIADVKGNAVFMKNKAIFESPNARIQVDAQSGTMTDLKYSLLDVSGTGRADKAEFLDDGHIRLKQLTYTTCTPENLAWYFSSSEIEIDQDAQTGKGKNGVLHFFDTPVLYTPYFSIPMGNERKSGLLTPTFGVSSNNGLDITQPYYVNIAPNRDLTLYPRYLSTRGTQLGAEYRYLDRDYSGILTAEYLPSDAQTGGSRWSYSVAHTEKFTPEWRGYINYMRVSDDLYVDDLGRTIGQALTRQFNQEIGTTYNAQGWSFLTRVQKFQTLQPDPTNLVVLPYDREPQLNARYQNMNWNGAVVKFESDFSRFTYAGPIDAAGSVIPNRGYSSADRTFINTSISYPYITPGYYITPKISFRANNYMLSGNDNYSGLNQSFSLPTVSLDSSLFFERDATELSGLFGRNVLMTLEPRIMYVYTPYRDQTQVPLFDTGSMGFGVSQIFAENTFVGNDRIADNNKVTMGVTSRILDEESGIERVRGIVAQRFDLTGQRVGLIGDNPVDPNNTQPKYSDLLMGASTRLAGNVNIDAFNEYSYDLNRSVNTSLTMSWRPAAKRMLNFSTRYTFDPTQSLATVYQNEVSGQWPVSKNLYAIGRWSYDLISQQSLNTLAGLEYDQECWALRLALQRFVNTSQLTTSQVFVQIEFKGLSGVGNNPIDIMKFNIPGYVPTNATPTPRSPFERYE